MDLYSIVLAAGKGTRMNSKKPKVLQEILGTPMINIILKELNKMHPRSNYVVVGYNKEEIKKSLELEFDNIKFETQEEQLGTAHAVLQLKDKMKMLEGDTLIMCGDTPLITAKDLSNFINYHIYSKNDLTILSALVENSYGYGRVIRDKSKMVTKIVEEKDATTKEKEVNEINSGIYVVNNKLLFEYIEKITNDNASGEYYLTDLIQLFIDEKLKVGALVTSDSSTIQGVNSLMDLAKAADTLKARVNETHLEAGVKIIDPNNTYIGIDVEIEEGTTIYPNNYIIGKVKIGKDNILKPSNYIENSIIGNHNVIGPMAHIRGFSNVTDNTRIGNFVELKNAKLEKGVKSAHLTYLGDTSIGESTNIGCGVITANYDGKNKFESTIGNNVFVGSNVNLIAPIEIKDNSFIAAGTTVTQNIDKDKFVIGRVKESIKELKKKK